jgi:2-dehydropantoate 2-reductase
MVRPISGPAQATADIPSIGTVDVVLCCVNLWDLERVAEQLRAIVESQTAVIPLQNGLEAAERLIPILGYDAIMGGVAFVTGTIVAPGVIRQTGTYQRMTFGELDGRISERGQRLGDRCEAAGFEGVLSSDIMVPIWEKLSCWCRSAGSTR